MLERALEPVADAVSVGPESTGWLANVSFLVKQDSAEEFLAAVERARVGTCRTWRCVERAPAACTASSSPDRPSRRSTAAGAVPTPERGDEMGLISEVLLLPLAPVRGAGWAIRQC